jgi:acyl dehydratase
MTASTDILPDSGEVTANIVGKRYLSRWFEVTQKQIDVFSEATHDHQWIHKVTVGEGRGPFGGPIAHGLLLLSIALNLAQGGRALPDGAWVLYGFDRLRFHAPVRSGTYVRCLTAILGVQDLAGRCLLNVRLVIETEDRTIPVLTANCALLRLKEESKR